MKKNSMVLLILVLIVISSCIKAQNKLGLSIEYSGKNLNVGSTLSEFRGKFPLAVQVNEVNQLLIYQLNSQLTDFRLYFNKQQGHNLLLGFEISCGFDDCYSEGSVYNSITSQLKQKLSEIIRGTPKNGTTITYYHTSGYLGIDNQYVGEESGDPIFIFKLLDLKYLSYFPDWINYATIFELSNIVFSQGDIGDYNIMSGFVEKAAYQKLEENPNDISSYYNPYKLLTDIYEKRNDLQSLLLIWKKIEQLYLNDLNVKSEISKYEKLIEDKQVNTLEIEESQSDKNFSTFWQDFKDAVLKKQKNKVISYTHFPFYSRYGSFLKQKEFSDNYDWIFDNPMMKGIMYAQIGKAVEIIEDESISLLKIEKEVALKILNHLNLSSDQDLYHFKFEWVEQTEYKYLQLWCHLIFIQVGSTYKLVSNHSPWLGF